MLFFVWKDAKSLDSLKSFLSYASLLFEASTRVFHILNSLGAYHGEVAVLMATSIFLPDCPCCCSVAQSCPTLWDPVNCSTPGFSVLHHLPQLAQIQVH